MGDFLLLERIESDLTQPELAKKAGVTELRVRAWEYNHETPTPDEWQVLTDIFALKNMPENLKPYGGL